MRSWADSLTGIGQQWNATLASSADELSRAASSLASRAADAVRDEYRQTYEDLGLRMITVRPELLVVDFPRPSRVSLLAARLNRVYGDDYLVVNFSGQSYNTGDLEGPVMDIAMSGCVPPLNVLLRLCVSAHMWLSASPRRVLVAHGCDDRETSAAAALGYVVVFLACYLNWTGAAPNPKESMLDVCDVLSLPVPFVRPSQRRYVTYFELQQHGHVAADAPALRIARIVLVGLGDDIANKTVEVFQQDQRVFCADLDGQAADGFIVQVGVIARGDLRVRVVSDRAGVLRRNVELEVCFHSAFITGDYVRFLEHELDVDSSCKAAHDRAVDIFFDSPGGFDALALPRESGTAASAAAAAACEPPTVARTVGRAEIRALGGCCEGNEESTAWPVFGGGATRPTFFDLAAEDDEDEHAVRAGELTSAVRAGPQKQKAVFIPDDIDSFFNDM